MMKARRNDYTGKQDNLQDRRRLVRDGYNTIANAYLAARAAPSEDVNVVHELAQRLPPGALILDAGCGAGVPISRLLQRRHRVVGVDFSEAQLALARTLVPGAAFVCQDLTALAFRRHSFDAICSIYAIIHIPRQEHMALLQRFGGLLKPGGLALLCLGAEDLELDVEDDYFGRRMHWSHFDAETNLRMVQACGLALIWSRLVPDSHEADSSHLFVLARKPPGNDAPEPV